MKKYTIKNYKGNLLESLSNFKKKYPGMKIVEAVEQDDNRLDIVAEENDITEDFSQGDTEQSEKNWAEVREWSAKLPEALNILHNYVYKCNDAVAFDVSKGMNNASSNIGDIREQMRAVQRLESEFDEYLPRELAE